MLWIEKFSLEFTYVKGDGGGTETSSLFPLFDVSKCPTILPLRTPDRFPLHQLYLSPGGPVSSQVSVFSSPGVVAMDYVYLNIGEVSMLFHPNTLYLIDLYAAQLRFLYPLRLQCCCNI